jgi:bacterioferritin
VLRDEFAGEAIMDNKQILIDALNHDLASEFQAVIMYTTYSAMVKGPYRPQLVQFMQGEIPDELGHAQFLADKIAAMGGIPNANADPVPSAETPQEMLEHILHAEQQAIAQYGQRAEQARQAGDLGLAVQLENMVQDETTHFEETKKILSDWA